ncbi:MAG: 30S ribosomal protein S17e [Halobacteriota archaeon]|nr:30S ribosomal protein S17e [Halobacteriota archaeon]
MGNIRPTYIKSIGAKLLRNFPQEFSADFNENKEKVMQKTDITSKVIRNRVAGYITRKMRPKEKGNNA